MKSTQKQFVRRCYVQQKLGFFAARTACKVTCEAAYLSHHAVVVAIVMVSTDGGGGTPLGNQCSNHRPLA